MLCIRILSPIVRRRFMCSFSTLNDSEFVIQDLSGKQEGIKVFGFNRPAVKNAMSRSLVSTFKDALDSIQHDKNVRALILRSMVPGIFCAGADLKERAKMKESDVAPFVAMVRKLLSQIEDLPMPVIAAIDGVAMGGGTELALTADIRIAADNAKIGLTETKLAIIPGAGGTQRLPRLVGPAIAKEMIYTSKMLDGKESQTIGLVNHCVPQNSEGNAAYEKALEIAEQIIQNGPIGIRMAKIAITKGLEVDLQSGLAIEGACYAQVIPTKDRIEALSAFREKRKPNFKGE